eukprot:scpid112310/ scgid9641/ 
MGKLQDPIKNLRTCILPGAELNGLDLRTLRGAPFTRYSLDILVAHPGNPNDHFQCKIMDFGALSPGKEESRHLQTKTMRPSARTTHSETFIFIRGETVRV